jgi:hypothetical protein
MSETNIKPSLEGIDATVADLRNQAKGLIQQAKELNDKADQLESARAILVEFAPPSTVNVVRGRFYDIPIKRAAIMYLREVGEPMGTTEIANALVEGGIETESKAFYRTLFNVLTTAASRKNNPEVIKMGAGWGLPEWTLDEPLVVALPPQEGEKKEDW